MEIIRSIVIIMSCFTGVILFLAGYTLGISNLSLIGVGILAISISFLLFFPEKFVREELIPSTVIPTMDSFSAIVNYFGAKGKGIYIPSTDEHKECRLIVPINVDMNADKLVLPNFGSKSLVFKDGIILIPSGIELMHLLEKEMRLSFAFKELTILANILNKSLIEILKIAETVYVNIVGNKVYVQIFNSVFFDSCIRVHVEHPNICTQICCPLCSLIACIITKMTGGYVTVEDSIINDRERSIDLSLRIS